MALRFLDLDVVREVVLRCQHASLPDHVAGDDHAQADFTNHLHACTAEIRVTQSEVNVHPEG